MGAFCASATPRAVAAAVAQARQDIAEEDADQCHAEVGYLAGQKAPGVVVSEPVVPGVVYPLSHNQKAMWLVADSGPTANAALNVGLVARVLSKVCFWGYLGFEDSRVVDSPQKVENATEIPACPSILRRLRQGKDIQRHGRFKRSPGVKKRFTGMSICLCGWLLLWWWMQHLV